MSALNRTAAHLPELLSTARAHRSGKNFYAFLDLEPSSKPAEIKEALSRYTKLWQGAAETEGLPAEGLADANALLDAATKVRKVLLSKKARKQYDERLGAEATDDLIALPVSYTHLTLPTICSV